MGKNILSKGEELGKGGSLESSNGKFKVIFQDDGNFVIYQGSEAIWSSDTHGTYSVRVCMQEDCNLVIYSDNGKPRWCTETCRSDCSSCDLQLTDDCKLVMTADGEQLLSSA
ncbi:hypothetical protein ABVT39_001077 [Epinephelus coioides]